jgi:hypothetical protein
LGPCPPNPLLKSPSGGGRHPTSLAPCGVQGQVPRCCLHVWHSLVYVFLIGTWERCIVVGASMRLLGPCGWCGGVLWGGSCCFLGATIVFFASLTTGPSPAPTAPSSPFPPSSPGTSHGTPPCSLVSPVSLAHLVFAFWAWGCFVLSWRVDMQRWPRPMVLFQGGGCLEFPPCPCMLTAAVPPPPPSRLCCCSYRYQKNKPFIKSRYCRGVPGA